MLAWEYRPNAEYTDNFGHIFRTDAHGWRNPLTTESTSTTIEIAFVGDSVTLGTLVDEPDTFVRSIASDHISTMNCAVDGYDAVQIAELLVTRVIELDPDVVVYVMCMNDFDFDESSADRRRYFNPPKCFVWERVWRATHRMRREEFHRYHFARRRDVVFAAIGRMAEACDAHGTRFIVAIMPLFDRPSPDFKSYPWADLHDAVVDHLRSTKIEIVDLLPAFAATGEPPGKLAFDQWHLTATGHQVVASRIDAALGTERTAP